MWAIGCIYAELLSLRPIFKGDEAKLDSKKTLPFQRDQMGKICEVLGPVKRERVADLFGLGLGLGFCGEFGEFGECGADEISRLAEQWPGIVHMPEWKTYLTTGP
jgi:cyclin-dependent kinase 8/11